MKPRSVCVAILSLLPALILTVGTASAQVYMSQFGSQGSANGQFESPGGVAVDYLGNIIVTDKDNNRIQEFDSSGTFVRQFGTSPATSFWVDVAVDLFRNIYAVDQENRRVVKFDPSGNFLLQIEPVCTPGIGSCLDLDGAGPRPPVYKPEGVAVDVNGNVYVTGTYHVQKFFSTGGLLKEFPLGASLFRAIAIQNNGDVVVWEKENGTINVYAAAALNASQSTDPPIPPVLQFGDSEISFPNQAAGLAVDPSGTICVGDLENSRILKYSSSGAYLGTFGAAGSGPGQFAPPPANPPSGIKVWSGKVYVADTANHRIQIFAKVSSSQSVASTTGVGTVTFTASNGSFSFVNAVPEASLPAVGKPAGVVFPYGFFDWTVTGLTPGETITVSMTFPTNVALPAQYWKAAGGTWTNVSSLLGDDDGDQVLTLTIDDGRLGDADGVANGSISDPGGVTSTLRVSSARVSGTTTSVTWTNGGGSVPIDVVRGDLVTLRSTAGNFASATTTCLANDTFLASLTDAGVPAVSGGFWYLVRGGNGLGTYDSGAPSQIGNRDAEIIGSGLACP